VEKRFLQKVFNKERLRGLTRIGAMSPYVAEGDILWRDRYAPYK
jgi:hypothetical protein